MKRIYFYSYLLTLVIIGCGPELRTVVERDKYNRIILEAELKGEVDTNWVKLHTYHFVHTLKANSTNNTIYQCSNSIFIFIAREHRKQTNKI
jgi:hypothetical protein